jgi:SAM-dependent methyltransferase
VADLPIALPPDLSAVLLGALDQERKIDRALEALGPVADRDVALVGGGPAEAGRLRTARARQLDHPPFSGRPWELAGDSADVVVGTWSSFRGVDPLELAEADRVLRPGGRLLVVHDYGRDDVSRLRGELPEHGDWSRRDGPFLQSGFRIKVIHCFWTFESLELARPFLVAAFGPAGEAVAADMKRPRLSYNVAVYHRTAGERRPPDEADQPRPLD